MAAQTLLQVQLVLRLTLALIFLISAAAKLRAPAAFVQGVLEYRVLPRRLAQLYGRLPPFAELGTGLLLSGLFLPTATGPAVLMLVSFAIAIAIVTAQGRTIGCHCLGAASVRPIGWHTLTRNLLLLGCAAWLLVVSSGDGAWAAPQGGIGSRIPAYVVAVLLVLAYWLIVEVLEVFVRMTHPHGGAV